MINYVTAVPGQPYVNTTSVYTTTQRTDDLSSESFILQSLDLSFYHNNVSVYMYLIYLI